MKYFGMILSFLTPFTLSSHASTQANFFNSKHGQIYLDNQTSNDADFLWSVIKTNAVNDRNSSVKSFSSPNQQLSWNCRRTNTAPVTTKCVLDIQDVQYSITVVDPEKRELTADLEDKNAQSTFDNLLLPKVLIQSPDGRLTFCTVCGLHDGELTVSWK